MKQLLQNLANGTTYLEDVPLPHVPKGFLLIRSNVSLISSGTERMLVNFGKSNLIEKAKQHPDKIRQVLQKIKTDGIVPTWQAVQAKLNNPLPLGYSNAGRVISVGDEATRQDFQLGDRVVSNGCHAEYVCVPKNLCAKIPPNVTDLEASFTVLGAIGLQGIRLLQPTIGETICVMGLGLIGLLCVQILRANGCQVIGMDFDERKCGLATEFGAKCINLRSCEDPVRSAVEMSKGPGVDGVLITASTTSNEPVSNAARMCRKRGRIVLIGVCGLNIARSDFYEKELTFQVSCSYGPGRYDPQYEKRGNDYPLGYVRWTEQRNFETMLGLLSQKTINAERLVSDKFEFTEAPSAYQLVSEGKGLAIVLRYRAAEKEDISATTPAATRIQLREAKAASNAPGNEVVIGYIGAGNFSGQVLLPLFTKQQIRLKSICSSGGVSGTHLGKKFGFEESVTDAESIFKDPAINTVCITTRHSTHAQFVIAGIKAAKNIFVEKPLCLTRDELRRIQEALTEAAGKKSATGRTPVLMVGYNRRFASQIVIIEKMLRSIAEPKCLILTINAGEIPRSHWVQDNEEGGGRIIGEGCHFVDLLRFLAGYPITSIKGQKAASGKKASEEDVNASIQLGFADGSIGTIHYFTNGSKSYPKEKMEVFCAGKVLHLDNYKKLTGYGWSNFKKQNLWVQDKGHAGEVDALIKAIRTNSGPPIPLEEILEVSEKVLDLHETLV